MSVQTHMEMYCRLTQLDQFKPCGIRDQKLAKKNGDGDIRTEGGYREYLIKFQPTRRARHLDSDLCVTKTIETRRRCPKLLCVQIPKAVLRLTAREVDCSQKG